MSAPFTRPKFHFGQVLGAEDLNALIDFVHGKNRLTAQRHDWGVVTGLEVTYSGGNGISIARGSAVTAAGDDIVVTEQCSFTVTETLPRDLALKYVEKEEQPVSGAEGPPADPCAPTSQPKKDACSRIVENYEVVTLGLDQGALKPNIVPLARLSRPDDVIKIDPGIRRYFGNEVRPDPEGKLPLGKVIGLDVLEATAMLTRWGVVVSEWTEAVGSPVASSPTARRGELVQLVSDRVTGRVVRVESCEVWT